MTGIDTHLKTIKEGVFGRDVRQAIHDSIEQVYHDASQSGNANMEVSRARGEHVDLFTRLSGIDATAEAIKRKMQDGNQGVQQRIKEVESQIANLIVTEGNGTVPSELIDMRVGLDGRRHASAGEAMRKGMAQITEELAKDNQTDAVANWWYHKVPDIYISPTNENQLVIEFPEAINGFTIFSKFGSRDVSLASLFPVLAIESNDVIASFDSAKRTLTLTRGKLVANLKTGHLELRSFSIPSTNDELTLIANNARNGSFGALLDDTFKQKQVSILSGNVQHSSIANWWYHKVPDIYISPTNENQLVIEFPEATNGFTIFSRHGKKDVYLSSVFPVLSNSVSGVVSAFDTVKRTLTLTRGKLVANLKTWSLELRPFETPTTHDELTLIANNARNGSFGALLDDSIIQKQIIKPVKDSNGIPEYWKKHIEQKISEIQLAQTNASLNSFAFLWVTDTHWESNQKNSPTLIKHVMNSTNIYQMVHGGDVVNGGEVDSTKKNIISSLCQFRPASGFLPVVMGNHDPNLYGKQQFTYPELMNMISKGQGAGGHFKFADYPNSFAWSIDYTRSDNVGPSVYGFAFDTFTNSNVSISQIQAFIDLCKNEGHVVTFMHWALDNGKWSATSQAIGDVVDAINQRAANVTVANYGTFDLSEVKAHVACLLSGHEHQDNVKHTAGGTPHIITTCDVGSQKASNDPYEYQPKTTTEQAFDVFVIDFDNKTIKDIRIGRGENREFTFS